MKICLITKECFPFYYGGIGSAFYALGCMLSGMGHEVVLLTKKPANLEEQSLNAYYRSNFSVEWVPYHQSEYSPHFVLDYAFQLERHFEKFNNQFNADVVLYPDFDGEAYFLVRAKARGKYPDTRFVIHYSGPLFCLFEAENRTAGTYERIIFHMEAFCIRNSLFAIAPSAFISDILHQRFHLDDQQKYLLPNPVNPLVFGKPLEAGDAHEAPLKNIVFVGRLQKTKGADTLLQAFLQLVNRNPGISWHLQMIGRDVYWEEYDNTFINYWKERLPEAVWEKVEFTEHVPQAELLNYLKDATLAVFPSRFETFGNVALEAAYCGVPVLVSKDTGLASITGEEYGFYWTEEEGPDGLAIMIEEAVKNQPFLEALRNRIHQRAMQLHQQTPKQLSQILHNITRSAHKPVANGALKEESSLFDLLNFYTGEALRQKTAEIEHVYHQKDEELKSSWQAYDSKEEELRNLWQAYDKKDEELRNLWLVIDQKNEEIKNICEKHERQINEAWQAYDKKDEELRNLWLVIDQKNEEIKNICEKHERQINEAWQAYDKKDEEIQNVWKMSDEKDQQLAVVWKKHDQLEQQSAGLQQELNTLQKAIESAQEEIQQIKNSEDYLLGKKSREYRWLRYLLKKL